MYSNFLIVILVVLVIWFLFNLSRGRVKNMLAGSFRMSTVRPFQRQFGYVTKAENSKTFWFSVIVNIISLIVISILIVILKANNM
jgi:hypothetical protein